MSLLSSETQAGEQTAQSPQHWQIFFQLVLALSIVAIFPPVLYSVGMEVDYPLHVSWAKELAATGVTELPHYLFQQATIMLRALIPFRVLAYFIPAFQTTEMTWLFSGFATVVLCIVAVGEMIYLRLIKAMSNLRPLAAYLLGILITLSLLLVGPVTIFTWWQGRLYFGYISPTVFHNPTIWVLKPLALGLFWLTCRQFFGRWETGPVLWTALLSVLALQAKPSYTIALLPALGLTAAYSLWRRRPFNGLGLGAGFFLPSVLFLLYQYLLTFYEGQSGVVFAPFAMMGDFIARNDYLPAWMMLPLFLLSILFPLAVTVCYYRPAEKNFSFEVAWLAFFGGAALTYLFAESGDRQNSGNFTWSGQITLFVLFIESALLVLQRHFRAAGPPRFDWRIAAVSAVFLLHLISGIYFYIQEILQPVLMW